MGWDRSGNPLHFPIAYPGFLLALPVCQPILSNFLKKDIIAVFL